jgi:hypothetical protein
LVYSLLIDPVVVPFPVTDIYLPMPADDDDITELNSSTVPNSQEESTVPPSSPELSTQKKKRVTSPGGTFTPRRSKRVRGEEANEEEVVILNDEESVLEVDAEGIQQEKDYVKLIKRKTKKGQSSPVWTYDYFRIAEMIDGWQAKNIG